MLEERGQGGAVGYTPTPNAAATVLHLPLSAPQPLLQPWPTGITSVPFSTLWPSFPSSPGLPPPPPEYRRAVVVLRDTVTFAHCTAAECVCWGVWGAVCLFYSISRYPPSDRSTGFALTRRTYEQGGGSCIGPALQQLFTRGGISPRRPADTPPHPRILHADHHGPFIFGRKQWNPPCPNTVLSKHGDPMFLHFCPLNQNLARVRTGGGESTI